MLICIGYYPGDLHQAEHLAGWLKEIGPFPGHSLLVARDTRTEAKPFMDVGFDSVQEILVPDDVWNSWPQSANNVFRKCIVFNEYVTKAPYWLWIEPDVVPLHQGAFDILEAEYGQSGKVFLGDKVVVENVPTHMSGVGIYPGAMSTHAGEAKVCMDIAWDMAIKDQTVPHMHESKRIMHAWRHPTFEDWSAVDREIFAFKPECVLFHASKDGSLINLLRERRQPTSKKFIQAPRAQILIKSYPPDYPLLKYALESVEKYASGFWKPALLVVPGDHIPQEASVVLSENLIVRPVTEEGNGYLFQQSIKANAHRLIDADYVLHTDSDTVFTCPITPETFFMDGKPVWFVTPYSDTHSPWKASTEKFIGHPIELEFMRRLPMFIPRSVHEKAASFCLEKHGMNLHRYIMESGEFSEFNALGAIAWDYFRDEIHWFDTSAHPESEWPPLVALQTWSHAPVEENIAKFETLSGAGIERPIEQAPLSSIASLDNGQGEPAAAGETGDIEHPRQNWIKTDENGNPVGLYAWDGGKWIQISPIIPWANQAESEAEIKRLCRELRKFQTAPRYIDRVRKELACFQVVTGDKAIKGMIKRRHRLGPDYDPMKPETLTKKQKAAIANINKGRQIKLGL